MRKTSITRRWLVNSLGGVFIVLTILITAAVFFIRNYYYSAAQQYMVSRMNMVSSMLQASYNNSALGFSADLRNVVERWSEKEKMELMAINSRGEIELTSSGFAPTVNLFLSDYFDALDNGSSGYAVGRSSGGEKIMAISVITPPNSSGYTAVRLVSSLEDVDKQIYYAAFALIVICVLMLCFMFFTGSYFIRSIVIPVTQLSGTARRYAVGDFSIRIQKKNDDEIGQLCDAVNNMAKELALSENMKNDFISSVSHELRTPLTAIKGWAETIRSMPNDGDAVEKGMRVITGETERLSQMVEELLDFSRMQNKRLSLNKEKLDILAEIGEAVLIYAERAKKDGITVIYEEPDMLPFIFGDKNRLRQVFINVIDNAIKYTDSGGEVTVQALMSDAEHIQIDVSDTGCGISEHDLPKIRTKFYKANHTKRGSGIGLAIADEIISMHGGNLDIFSKLGVGTTVKITLPV
ncbi:MAG: HAMP domain-containing histidine kinase [Oscillospiraceae bacterium]|nr:HAMP domain-containing histidine kinase [Oscillospiraceae bacterium]